MTGAGVGTIIPTSFIPLPPPELDGIDPRRVTLLHKKGDTLVCIVARGSEEISYEKPIEDAIVIKMYGKKVVFVGFEPKLTLRERKVGDKSYTITNVENLLSNKIESKKIPYLRSAEFVSEFVEAGNNLDKKINDALTASNERLFAYCESISDFGFFKGIRSKKIKEANKKCVEVGASIYSDLEGLFHEEPDNIPVRKHDLKVIDRKLPNYFVDRKSVV